MFLTVMNGILKARRARKWRNISIFTLQLS